MSKALKVVLLVPHFSPDTAPTGEVITRIAEQLVKRGHRLHVITSLPWYAHHQIELEWRGKLVRHEKTDWGEITRVYPFPAKDKQRVLARAFSFVGFTIMVGLQALRGSQADVVLAMSPPLTLGWAGWLAAKRNRAPLVLNLQDVYPDIAIDVGVLRGARIISVFRMLERWSYRVADGVTVLSEDLRLNVAPRADDEAKVRVIPNFVDIERVQPMDPQNSYREEFGLSDKTVVMYAGNVGFSQPLELMLEAAKFFSGNRNLAFVINGGGGALPALKLKAEGMANVHFVPMQDRERLPEVLAASDIQIVCLKRGLAKSSVPSKLYSILAAGRAVLASVDENSEVASSLEQSGAGIAVPPEDAEAFIAGLQCLVESPDLVTKMGSNGRSFVESWMSPAGVAEAYEELFLELIGQNRPE